MKKRNTIHFKRWKGNVRGNIVIHIKKNRNKGELHMAVSKAYLSCLDKEAAKLFEEDIKSANLSKDVAKRAIELFNKLMNNQRDS